MLTYFSIIRIYIFFYYSLNTLFTKTNPLWLISELIKALEIKTTIMINLVLLTTAELIIAISISTNKVKPETETHPAIAEAKVIDFSM